MSDPDYVPGDAQLADLNASAPEVQNDPQPPETVYPAPPITGYRALRSEDVNHANAFKAKEAEILELLARATAEASNQERCRQLALARTNIQQGFMWAVKAILAPECQ